MTLIVCGLFFHIQYIFIEVHMNLLNIFSLNVKKYRQLKKLSQEKLAEMSNLHRTYISDIECGRRNISIENIEKIAGALEIDAYLLFKKDENKDKYND